MDAPGNNACMANNCASGYEQGVCPWRQLGKNFYRNNPDSTGKDAWQNNNGRLELKTGFYLAPSYPSGTYTGYTRVGPSGMISSATFDLQDKKTVNSVTIYTTGADLKNKTTSYTK